MLLIKFRSKADKKGVDLTVRYLLYDQFTHGSGTPQFAVFIQVIECDGVPIALQDWEWFIPNLTVHVITYSCWD